MSDLSSTREEILYGQILHLEKRMRMLRAAVKEAANIFSTNPPGDLGLYTPEMLTTLVGSTGHPEKWERYLIRQGVVAVMKEDGEYEDKSVD
jgi:hypothetical protein